MHLFVFFAICSVVVFQTVSQSSLICVLPCLSFLIVYKPFMLFFFPMCFVDVQTNNLVQKEWIVALNDIISTTDQGESWAHSKSLQLKLTSNRTRSSPQW